MTQAEKLLEKMRRLPPDMPLDQVQTVLTHLGWTLDRTRGSHLIYNRNERHLSIPHRQGHVKRVYLQQILDPQKDVEGP